METNRRFDEVDLRLSKNEVNIAEDGARGKEALEEVKALKDETRDLKVIVWTGKGVVQALAWLGGGALALWAAIASWFKIFGGG